MNILTRGIGEVIYTMYANTIHIGKVVGIYTETSKSKYCIKYTIDIGKDFIRDVKHDDTFAELEYLIESLKTNIKGLKNERDNKES